MIALLDGDILAYRAASIMTSSIDWESTEATREALDPSAAADAACQTVDAWTRIAGCKECVVTFTGRENFRKRVLPSYKMNRSGKVKPQHYNYVVSEVKDRFDCRVVEGLEADDLMGIMLTTLPKYLGAVCVTLDKDLRTIPGLHLNPLKDNKPVLVTAEQGDLWWLTQVLTGDTSDGYKGLPGCGPKKAAAILGTTPRLAADLWPKVVAAYRAGKLTEEDALVQARVARILRRSDYCKDSKEIALWHPTTPVLIPVMHLSTGVTP